MTTPGAGCFPAFLVLVGLLVAVMALMVVGQAVGPGGLFALLFMGGVVGVLVLASKASRPKTLESGTAKQFQAAQAQGVAMDRPREFEMNQRAAWEEQQRDARWQFLCATYDEPTARQIFAGRIWLGQRQDMLLAALGNPGANSQHFSARQKSPRSAREDQSGRRCSALGVADAVTAATTMRVAQAPVLDLPSVVHSQPSRRAAAKDLRVAGLPA